MSLEKSLNYFKQQVVHVDTVEVVIIHVLVINAHAIFGVMCFVQIWVFRMEYTVYCLQLVFDIKKKIIFNSSTVGMGSIYALFFVDRVSILLPWPEHYTPLFIVV